MVQTKWHDPREKTSTIPIHIEQFPASSLAQASTPNPKLSKLPTTIKTAHFWREDIPLSIMKFTPGFPLYFDTLPKTVFGHLGNFSNAPISCENRVENSVSTQWKETSRLMKCPFISWRMKPTSFEFWCVFSWEKVMLPMRVWKWKFPTRALNSLCCLEKWIFLKTRVRETMVGSQQCLRLKK